MGTAPRDEQLVRIVYAFVDDRRDHDPQLAALLSDEERARHGRLHFARDRAAFLLAHGLLRSLLSELLGGEPSSHRFEAGAHGKPALVPPEPSLDFNLSHTAGLVACALAWRASVGVDVEHAERRVDLDGVGRRVFSTGEQAVLAALSGEAQADRFFEYWTLKEAYMKARGMGFALPPAGFELIRASGGEYTLRHLEAPDPAADWTFHATRLGQHRLACAVGAPGRIFSIEERRL